jgi:hypothetical protein
MSGQVICKRCSSINAIRLPRANFFQKTILFRLGLHPWKCVDCSHQFFSNNRGPRRKTHSSKFTDQVPLS